MAQLDAIRHEIRSISIINPGPLTRSLNNLDQAPISNGNVCDLCTFYIETNYRLSYNFTDTVAKILYNHVVACCCRNRQQETRSAWGEYLNILFYQGLLTRYTT
jgi:hypothetical protein